MTWKDNATELESQVALCEGIIDDYNTEKMELKTPMQSIVVDEGKIRESIK